MMRATGDTQPESRLRTDRADSKAAKLVDLRASALGV